MKQLLIFRVSLSNLIIKERSRENLYRLMFLTIKKHMLQQYKHIVSRRKIDIICSILCVYYTDSIYNVLRSEHSTNYIGMVISIDLLNSEYKCISFNNDEVFINKAENEGVYKFIYREKHKI